MVDELKYNELSDNINHDDMQNIFFNKLNEIVIENI